MHLSCSRSVVAFALPALSLFSTSLSAQTVDRPLDDGIVNVPQIAPERPQIGTPSVPTAPNASDAAPPVTVGNEDLKKDPRLADLVLGNAVQARAWQVVEGVLGYYRDIPGHDPMMALYAQGALDREQGHHGKAIAAYREMVHRDATLSYVRLDLAAMLFEDKRYGDARQEFERLRNDHDLALTAQQAVEQFLSQLRSQTGWHGTIRLGYKYNDNVNQASPDRFLYIFGLPFEKNPESLPRSANALNYFASLSRDFNVTGNHFLGVEASINGDHYWDERDWRETTATLQAGYRYRDVKSWASVMPLYNRAWLGGKPYRRDLGVSVEYGRWVSPKWQVIGNYAWFNKRYAPVNFDIYDGDLHALTATAVWFKSPRTILYGGLTTQRDLLEAKDESSSRNGASLGFIKVWNNGLHVRGNARYSFRRFREYSLWDRTTIRRDHEYQFDFSLAHSQLRVAGIYPRLSYQFLKVDSNIPSLYARTGNQLTLSLETSF